MLIIIIEFSVLIAFKITLKIKIIAPNAMMTIVCSALIMDIVQNVFITFNLKMENARCAIKVIHNKVNNVYQFVVMAY